ncbi:MAG: hypothetical protein ACI4UN_02595 [Muribaculaceae bacterium]
MKKYIALIVAAILPIIAAAQFKVTENNGNVTTTPGNLTFSHPDANSWQVLGIDINNISSIERIARTGAIELDRQLTADGEPSGMYFADTYNEGNKGVGNYYFLITNDEAASVSGTNVAHHPGGYVLYLDMFAPLSADHANAILPEGTYICTEDKAMYTTNLALTWASLNSDGTVGGIREIFPTDGSVVVRHTSDGGYEITANFINEDNTTISFHFVGTLAFTDLSGIEDDGDEEVHDPYIKENMYVHGTLATDWLYSTSNATCDNHVLHIFTTDQLTDDGKHVNVPGVKVEMDIYTEKGNICGTYTPGTFNGYTFKKEPGVFYPGKYYGSSPLGSLYERVNPDLSVQTGIITDGSITISHNDDDDTYSITGTLINSFGNTVTVDFRGPLQPYTPGAN